MSEEYYESTPQPTPQKPVAAFAGRQHIFARLQQYLIDPADRHALLLIGRHTIGKSAILQECHQILGENVVTVYFALSQDMLHRESAWLYHLVTETIYALQALNFNTERLPAIPEDTGITRRWIHEEFLPEIGKLIRPHRRLLWLFDDAEWMLAAIQNRDMPENSLIFLYNLLQNHLHLGIVLTLNENNESYAVKLAPLVDANRIQRLHPLNDEETAELMLDFASNMSSDANTHIFELTDGHPLLLQYIGKSIQSINKNQITASDIDSIINIVYAKAHQTYRKIWKQSLSQNERLVLTAISGLLYDDPISPLTTQRLENWLIETDFPLDMTSINAGIRGLEYRDLVQGSISGGIHIRGGLFQRWLIEHARMEGMEMATPTVATEPAEMPSFSFGRITIALGIVLLIVVIALGFALTQSSPTNSNPQPTVTIESASN